MPGKAASSISWSSAAVMAGEGGEGVAGAVVASEALVMKGERTHRGVHLPVLRA